MRWAAAGIASSLVLLLGIGAGLAGQSVDGAGGESAGEVAGEVATRMQIPRLAGAPRLDGDPGDAVWAAVAPLPMTLYQPVFRGTPTQRTDIRVAHDGEALWIAATLYDDDPDEIRVNTLARDSWSGDDVIAVFLDTWNDNETGLWFMTNAAGVRLDAELSDDGRRQNMDWNGHWDVRSRRTPEGWETEMRIPFSSMGLQVEGGDVTMGLGVTRLIGRGNERVTFPEIDPRYGFRQPSRFRDVRIDGLRAGRPTWVTGYALGTASRAPQLRGGGTDAPGPWEVARDEAADVGLDVKVNPSDNLTLDLTLNPDFAQVEADDQQINLTRFSLFFPEKRQFFQERAAIFDIQNSEGGRVFNSRSIGLGDDRQPVRILGGGRLTGRVGEWDVGALNMQTEGVRGGDPSTNFGVARVRRRVFNDFSNLGAMVTHRSGGEGRTNTTVVVDGVVRISGDDYVRGHWAQSADDRIGTGLADGLASGELFLGVQRRRQRGLGGAVDILHTGERYRPGMGFNPRPGTTRLSGYLNYFWFQPEDSRLRFLLPGAFFGIWRRDLDGSVQSATFRHWWEYQFKDGSGGWIEPELYYENVRTPFRLADGVEIPAGTYRFWDLWLAHNMSSGERFRVTADTRLGTFYDARRISINVSPVWNASKHLELGGSLQSNFLDFGNRGLSLNTHLAQLRVRAALDVRSSVNAFVQWNSTTDRVAMNVRLRHNFGEGNDLWLVWNQGLLTERTPLEAGQPRPPVLQEGRWTLKVTRTLGF